MTTAQLGPPPVAASRGGSAPSGSRSATDGATGSLVETEDGGFVAVLEGHTAPTSDATADAGQNPDAAGPQTGELPTEVVADADASDAGIVAPAEVAAVIAAAVVVAAPVAVAAPAAAPVPFPEAVPAGTAVVAPVATPAPVATAPAPVQPLPGLVPAVLDGDAAVAPMPTTVPASALAALADAPVSGTTPASGAVTTPAATLTLTLSAVTPEAVTGPVAPVVTDDAPAPAPAPRQDAAAAVPKAAEAPAPPGLAAPVPVAPHVDPLEGLTRAGGLTTPHELARELGHRVQMAVREGGRELLITLRPPELGHLTIRVTMIDGVLQAQIVADRPEAARLLQQSLSHLDSSLGDLGYSLDSLDVAYSGHDPRDAHGSTRGQDAAARDGSGDAGGTTPPASPSTLVAAGAPGGLDLLA